MVGVEPRNIFGMDVDTFRHSAPTPLRQNSENTEFPKMVPNASFRPKTSARTVRRPCPKDLSSKIFPRGSQDIEYVRLGGFPGNVPKPLMEF